MNADHSSICKFATPNNCDFELAVAELARIIEILVQGMPGTPTLQVGEYTVRVSNNKSKDLMLATRSELDYRLRQPRELVSRRCPDGFQEACNVYKKVYEYLRPLEPRPPQLAAASLGMARCLLYTMRCWESAPGREQWVQLSQQFGQAEPAAPIRQRNFLGEAWPLVDKVKKWPGEIPENTRAELIGYLYDMQLDPHSVKKPPKVLELFQMIKEVLERLDAGGLV